MITSVSCGAYLFVRVQRISHGKRSTHLSTRRQHSESHNWTCPMSLRSVRQACNERTKERQPNSNDAGRKTHLRLTNPSPHVSTVPWDDFRRRRKRAITHPWFRLVAQFAIRSASGPQRYVPASDPMKGERNTRPWSPDVKLYGGGAKSWATQIPRITFHPSELP
jgi:hypothetical protein